MQIRWLVHVLGPGGPAISTYVHHVHIESELGEVSSKRSTRNGEVKRSKTGNTGTMQEQDGLADLAAAKSNLSNKQPYAGIAVHPEVLPLRVRLRVQKTSRAQQEY
jgi:3D (Asp-Asp-Asp) domain-containing protein